MTNVFENTQKLDVEEGKKESSKAASITEDLTEIKGIGPSTALKLKKANINTIKQLADVSADELSVISGVNINSAQKFIAEAIKYLPEYSFETFDVAEIFIDEELLQQEFREKKVKNEPQE
jgi:predicted RecB family nuclease